MKTVIALLFIICLAGCASTPRDLSGYTDMQLEEALYKTRTFQQGCVNNIRDNNEYVHSRQTYYGAYGAMGVGTVENLGHALAARRASNQADQIENELRRRGKWNQ